jgi:hypothetical protein
MELAVRMAEVARATSEWHRRMTAENLSQSGYVVDLTKYQVGRNAFIYKPPTQAETIARGRKAKHIDHYVGPGTIVRHLGTRSMVIQMNGREFQRDAGMVLLEKPRADDNDPEIRDRRIIGVQKFNIGSQETNPLQEGEFIIMKDDPQARDWYCAEIRKILADRIEVDYYTSTTPPLEDYEGKSSALKRKRLREATFLRTRCLEKGKGLPTTTPPTSIHGKLNHLWWGRIPIEDIYKHVLIRGVGLSALGKLDKETIKLAALLEIPHHEGAGGEEDFNDKNAFQKHVRRVSNRHKRKRS